jgi:hypothetical protein
MRRVDPPANLYQKVWQSASKTGPATACRKNIVWNTWGEMHRRRRRGGAAVKPFDAASSAISAPPAVASRFWQSS